ncbi:hypothetical protein, partial [Parendozoicomonas sp. Alg238-R29]|uniref:hypothetical protein n=1 Tax=Parendozoicomonas sp. Alg238-R29 TaxID=2993446 RepID=UPI00248E7208
TTKKNVEHFPKSSPVGVSLPSKALPIPAQLNNPAYRPAYVWTDEDIINIDRYTHKLEDLENKDDLLHILSKCRTQEGVSFYVKSFDNIIKIANATYQLQKYFDSDSHDFLEKIKIECLRQCSSLLQNNCSINKFTLLCNIIRSRDYSRDYSQDYYQEVERIRSRIAELVVQFRKYNKLARFHSHELSITAAVMLKGQAPTFKYRFEALKAIAEEINDKLPSEINSWSGRSLSTLVMCIGCLKEDLSLPGGEDTAVLLKKMCDAQEKIAISILYQYQRGQLKKQWNIIDFSMTCGEFKNTIYRSDPFFIQQAMLAIICSLNNEDLTSLENSNLVSFVDACGYSIYGSANSRLIFLAQLYLNRLKTDTTQRKYLQKDLFFIMKALSNRRIDREIAEVGMDVCTAINDNVSDIQLILQWYVNWFLTLCHFKQYETAELQKMVKIDISQDQKSELTTKWLSTTGSTQLPDTETSPNMAKWQVEWIQDYWKKLIKRPLPSFCPDQQGCTTSDVQRKIYKLIKNKYPDALIGLECNVGNFCVDILLPDYNIAVEIDGASHFVYPDPEWINPRKEISSMCEDKSYRTKYQFVDHMLSKYGLTVYRIDSRRALYHSEESIHPICTQIDKVKCAPDKGGSERRSGHRNRDERRSGDRNKDERRSGDRSRSDKRSRR